MKAFNRLITHDGKFHTDEVMATAILRYIFNFPDSIINRTRLTDVLEDGKKDENTILIDVGGEYSIEKGCYDHHQENFNETGNLLGVQNNIPLSSCGLIYNCFGRRLVETCISNMNMEEGAGKYSRIYSPKIFQQFYKSFILPIDANDNGISFSSEELNFTPITLQSVISSMNYPDVYNDFEQKQNFIKAVDICTKCMENHLKKTVSGVISYREGFSVCNNSIRSNSKELTDMGILVFDDTMSKFSELHLRIIDKNKKFKFVVTPKGCSEDYWNIHTIKKNRNFETLMDLVSENKAKEKYGDDVVFIHKNLFIGCAKNRETAINIAKDSFLAGKINEADQNIIDTQVKIGNILSKGSLFLWLAFYTRGIFR